MNRYLLFILPLRQTLLYALACALFAFAPLEAAAHTQAENIKLYIAFTNYPPFHSRGAGNVIQGFSHDLIHEALAHRMGVKLIWEEFPWGRCQENVRMGKSDAMFTIPTKERLSYASTHKIPFYKQFLHIFTYAGHPRLKEIQAIKSIHDIMEKDFSVITYVGDGWTADHIRSHNIRVYTTPSVTHVWNMLAKRRGDIVIGWSYGAWAAIGETGLEKRIIQTDAVIDSVAFHLMVRKASPLASRLHEIDAVLEEMKKDGTTRRILMPYGLAQEAIP